MKNESDTATQATEERNQAGLVFTITDPCSIPHLGEMRRKQILRVLCDLCGERLLSMRSFKTPPALILAKDSSRR